MEAEEKISPLSYKAVQHWLDFGASPRNNPVANFAFSYYLGPLGILSAGLDVPVIPMLSTGLGSGKLINPGFSYQKIDWKHRSLTPFVALRGLDGLIASAKIDAFGHIEFELSPKHSGDLLAKEALPLLATSGPFPETIQGSFHDAVCMVIAAAQCVFVEGNDDLKNLFVKGDYGQFCHQIARSLEMDNEAAATASPVAEAPIPRPA